MRKTFAILFALLLALSLCACDMGAHRSIEEDAAAFLGAAAPVAAPKPQATEAPAAPVQATPAQAQATPAPVQTAPAAPAAPASPAPGASAGPSGEPSGDPPAAPGG